MSIGQKIKAARLPLILLIIAAAFVTVYWSWASSGVQQPIAFPHKTHIALGLTCTTCHQRAVKDAVAGRPPTAFCLGCHAGGDTQSAEIKKLREYGESGKEVPWRRVWRLPSHVLFPHQVHVTFAQLTCQTCHGPMETLTRPPAHALKQLRMDDCIACHDRQRLAKATQGNTVQTTNVAARPASADCTFCHR